MAWFSFGKEFRFRQKVLVFGETGDFLSRVINNVYAVFGVKGQMFLSISILVPKFHFCA